MKLQTISLGLKAPSGNWLFLDGNYLKIERTFGLFFCLALDGMGINHRGSHIAVTQQFLNRTDIIIGLQQMTGKTVTKGMGGMGILALFAARFIAFCT